MTIRRFGEAKRGRPQRQPTAPLGKLVLKAMQLHGLSYKDVVAASGHLASVYNNPDMRIGKSTLGNIISGSIRQPGTAKLDSLRVILSLSHTEMDIAIGLQPERRFKQQLQIPRARTHEVPLDIVTRHRRVKLPVLRDDADLELTQMLPARGADLEVKYLSSFSPPHLGYVIVGEEDRNAAPI